MKHSELAVQLVVQEESNGSGRPHLSCTVDERGRACVGYGHVVNGNFIVPMSVEECVDLLVVDFMTWEDWLNDRINQYLTQGQFDALVCWAYHVGQGRAEALEQKFANARLLNYVAEGKMQLAAAEFDNWVMVHQRPSKRVVARRQAEKYLFLYGDLPLKSCGSSAS